MIIGLTGGIGSGKTTVANHFMKLKNIAFYNADFEAKKLMNTSDSIKLKLVNLFGKKSYIKDELNRPYIRNIAFNNRLKLDRLNSIVHPEVERHFKKFATLNTDKSFILYESALLFETNSLLKYDKIISIFAPLQLKVRRIVLRDRCSEKEAEKKIKNQWIEDKKLLQSNYVIYNINREFAYSQVVRIYNVLIKKHDDYPNLKN